MGKLRVLGRMGDRSVEWKERKSFAQAQQTFQELVQDEQTHQARDLSGVLVEHLDSEMTEVILHPKMAGG